MVSQEQTYAGAAEQVSITFLEIPHVHTVLYSTTCINTVDNCIFTFDSLAHSSLGLEMKSPLMLT